MKRLRILALSLALTLLFGLLPGGTPRAVAAERYTTCPYWIGVDIVNQRLTVYNAADNSAAHRWLCTTGRAGYETPTGTFTMPDKKGDERKDWCTIDGYKVRYAVRVADGFYIHSVQYTDKKDDAVRLTSLAKLGHSGSLGSVIVEYAHAKWISQNCPKGTMVVVHAGVNDPLIADRLKGDAGTDTTESLPEPPSVESIALNPSSEFTIGIGETRQIGYTLKPSGAESSIEWESGTTKHATVDGSGLVRGVAEGDATIKARTVNGKEAKVKVKVVDKTKPTGIELRDKSDISMGIGDRKQLGYTLSPSTAVTALKWKSSKTKVATVDGNGVVTAVGEGEAKITVETEREGKKSTVKVKVTDKTKPTKVTLSVEGSYTWDGDRRVIKKGEGVQLRATLSPSNAVTDLEWKSSSTKRATVTGSGWVKAVGEGDFEIEVKTTREGKKDKLKFKVIDQPKKVSIKNDKTIKVGQTLQLTAEVEPKGTDPSVTWSSADTSIATVDGSGKVTGKKKGKVKITVKTVNGKTDTVKIKVEN